MARKERLLLLAEALESGQYAQGRGVLERVYPDGRVENCCLGVACRVAMANGLELTTSQMVRKYDAEEDGALVLFDDESAYPPSKIDEWYGTDLSKLMTTRDGPLRTPVNMNDGEKWSFEQIGDAFRYHYELGSREGVDSVG
jgi:hypothetical protein